ncbi:MAG: EAL domain-containing protein [Oceanospirillaceae bacterium]
MMAANFLITVEKIYDLQYQLLRDNVNNIISNSESNYRTINALGMDNVAFYRDATKKGVFQNIEKNLTPGTSVAIYDSKLNEVVYLIGNDKLDRLMTVEFINDIRTQKNHQHEHEHSFALSSGEEFSTLLAFGQYPNWNWSIVSFVDKGQLLKYSLDAVKASSVIAGIFLILILMVVFRLSNRISRAIVALQEGALQLSNSDLDVKIELLGNDEFTSLASSFNLMAAAIRSTESKLHQSIFEEKKTNLSLIDSRKQYHSLIEEMTDTVTRVDVDGCLLFVNKAACTMFGLSAEDCIGRSAFDFIHADDQLRTKQDLYASLKDKKVVFLHENRQVNAVGQVINVAWSIRRELDEFGNIIGFASTGRDITDRKVAEEKLKLAANVFTHAREGILITNDIGIIIDANDTFTTVTGFEREDIIGQNPRILQSGRHLSQFYVDMWQELLKKGFWSGEVWNRRKNGEIYPEILNISSVKDVSGDISNYVALFTDITLIKEHQLQLERIAHYDLLTGLPNRVLLSDRLSQTMLQCSRHGKSLAVAFLDLDGFKHVNDTHGHNVGDLLLIALSVRMKEALREDDSLARIGGDEFVAVLVDLVAVEDCEPILERLLLAASEPIVISDVIFNVSVSIGVTFYPQDSVDADQLMRHADQAMYVAKESGKNCYHLFDTDQVEAIKEQRESLEAIRSALDNHQFVLHYQPKVNMKLGTVTGVEALIRWQHPERGLLSPIEFLPVIENNPMMIEMGEWVIDTALTQISQWQAMGLNLPVSTSVNIAAVQLQQPDFTQRLATILAKHPDVEPRYLELEVLETSALDDVQHVSEIMNACITLGVNFALDDFGTGYSSLIYLRRLPANIIKIDQNFVRDMLIDDDDLAIVEGVTALAKSFKRDVIAEGVETIEHGTALLKLGCCLAQGYGIAKPMPGSDFPVWANHWKPHVSWQI